MLLFQTTSFLLCQIIHNNIVFYFSIAEIIKIKKNSIFHDRFFVPPSQTNFPRQPLFFLGALQYQWQIFFLFFGMIQMYESSSHLIMIYHD